MAYRYAGWENTDVRAEELLREVIVKFVIHEYFQDYSPPTFLHPNTRDKFYTPWLFMGMPGSGVPIHIDRVSKPPKHLF